MKRTKEYLVHISAVKWRHILFMLPCLFFVYSSTAQSDTTAPFFKSKKFESTAYVQAGVAATHMFKSAAATTHFSLHWVVNRKFVVGAHYHLLSSRNDIKKLTYPEYTAPIYATHHFAGLSFGYVFFNDKKFSLQPELAAGWANIKFTRFDTVTIKRNYGGIIPAVYGTWNATKILRIGIGINYRLIVGEKFKDINVGSLSGVGGLFFIRLGRF
ncbi:MAG: hypothetical protein KF872_00010 [Chitinophagales bacterium]|nr:hypothetical protein [Chitinophagales bacterium]